MLDSRRKNYLIAPRFQLGLSLKTSIFLVVYGTVIFYLGTKPVTELIQTLPFSCLTPELHDRLLTVPYEAVLLGLVIVLFVSLQVIRLTHRVAGPVFRLSREIREMTAGNYPRSISLRKYDYLKELAEVLTSLSRGLEDRRQALLGELSAAQGVVAECTSRLWNGAPSAAIQADLMRILEHLQTLKGIAGEKSGAGGEPQPSTNGETEGAPSETAPVSSSRI